MRTDNCDDLAGCVLSIAYIVIVSGGLETANECREILAEGIRSMPDDKIDGMISKLHALADSIMQVQT